MKRHGGRLQRVLLSLVQLLYVAKTAQTSFMSTGPIQHQGRSRRDTCSASLSLLRNTVVSLKEQNNELTTLLEHQIEELTRLQESNQLNAREDGCEKPTIPTGVIEPGTNKNLYASGATINVTCGKYQVPKRAQYTCQDGQWTPSAPTCSPWCPLDVAILLDSSTSRCNNWQNMKQFTHSLTVFLLSSEDADLRAHISIMRYSEHVYTDVELQAYEGMTPQLETTIQNLENGHGNRADTSMVLDMAHTTVFTGSGSDRPDVNAKDVVILVSDGSMEPDQETLAAAQRLRDDNVTLYSIGLTTNTDEISAPQLMYQTYTYWQAPDSHGLQMVLRYLAETFCNPRVPVVTAEPEEQLGADIIVLVDIWSGSSGRFVPEAVPWISNLVDREDTAPELNSS